LEKTSKARIKEKRRELGAMEERGYSQCRACDLAGIDPRVYRYRSTRDEDDVARSRLHELASERRRFGYRGLHILLKREVLDLNWKKLYRLYKEERLAKSSKNGEATTTLIVRVPAFVA